MAIMMNSKGTTEYQFKIGAKGPTIYSSSSTQKLYLNANPNANPLTATASALNESQIPTMNQVKNYILGFSTADPVVMSMGSYTLTAGTGVTINSKKIKAVITAYTIDTTNETINLTIEDVDVAPSN